MRASLCLVLLATFGCSDGFEPSRRAPARGDGAQPSPSTLHDARVQLRSSCAAQLAELPVDAELPAASSGEVVVQSRASGPGGCGDFGWLRARVASGALIDPDWAGPDRGVAAWDCCHSTLEYGVYRELGAGFEYVGGGLAYGELGDDQRCHYSVDNAPQQPGHDQTLALTAEGELRVAVGAWSHNDPALGHDGDDCATLDCYWPVRVRFETF